MITNPFGLVFKKLKAFFKWKFLGFVWINLKIKNPFLSSIRDSIYTLNL